MGLFDFQCSNYDCEEWEGGQNGHEEYTVYIEVPLKDDTTIFLKGEYDGYGHIEVANLLFIPIQFEDLANDEYFFCTSIWCEHCFDKSNEVTDVIPLDKLFTRDEYVGDKGITVAKLSHDLAILEKKLKETKDSNNKLLKAQIEQTKGTLIGIVSTVGYL